MPTSTSTPAPKAAKDTAAPKRLSKSKRVHKRRVKQIARKNAGTPS